MNNQFDRRDFVKIGAAAGAGVPVAEILGAEGEGMGAVLKGLFTYSGASGYPAAQRGALVTIVCSVLLLLLTLFLATLRRRSYGRIATGFLLLFGLLAMGGAEWAREDLRKPYVIGRYMFVNSVRLPASAGGATLEDPFSVEALEARGILATARFTRVPAEYPPETPAFEELDPVERAEILAAQWREAPDPPLQAEADSLFRAGLALGLEIPEVRRSRPFVAASFAASAASPTAPATPSSFLPSFIF